MTNKQKNTSIIIAIIAVILLITYSTFNYKILSSTTRSQNLYFPTQKERQAHTMQALLTGELRLDGNCLKVNGNLIVWPYGYSVQAENNVPHIYNEKKELVARGGNVVRLSGSQVEPSEGIIGNLSKFENESCKGPFWMVVEVIR